VRINEHHLLSLFIKKVIADKKGKKAWLIPKEQAIKKSAQGGGLLENGRKWRMCFYRGD